MLFNEMFYKDPYLSDHDAHVISCAPCKKGFGLVLDDTVFYPEGGGQPADKGVLRLENGNELPVLDVQRDKDDRVVHIVSEPLEAGTAVHEKIDWEHRFSLMQNHSGEHIVSGLINRTYGYENVGFHMSDVITIDISGELSAEQALQIEKEANRVIWSDILVDITYPGDNELSTLNYRSKKELEGKVRLINIENADSCACCGLHVSRTGEIGLIKLLSLIRYKGGVRIELVCGDKALANYESTHDSITSIKNLLSVKPEQSLDAVKHILEESEKKSARIAALSSRYIEMRVRELEPENGVILTIENELDSIGIRKLCDALNKSGKARVSAVLKSDDGGQGNTFRYVIASNVSDLKSLAPSLNKALNGRGGGSKEMIQGSFNAAYEDILSAIRSAT